MPHSHWQPPCTKERKENKKGKKRRKRKKKLCTTSRSHTHAVGVPVYAFAVLAFCHNTTQTHMCFTLSPRQDDDLMCGEEKMCVMGESCVRV